jgi:RNA polymerase sigma factor (sigma-70 family)
VRRFVRRCGVPASERDDCVQQVFMEAAVKLPLFQYNGHRTGLRAWFYQLVRSRAIDQRRRRSRRRCRDLCGLGPQEPQARSASPPERLEQAWQSELLDTALRELRRRVSALTYEVFCLRALQGLAVSAVAARLGLPPAQVHFRHRRAFEKLRRLCNLLSRRRFDSPALALQA